jgi:hypothetical protein
VLGLGGRDSRYRSESGRSGFAVQPGPRDVVAIADASLGRVGCNHAMTGIIEHEVSQEMIRLLPGQRPVGLMGG